MGVTTKKKIIPIIIGDINLPRKIPNLFHRMFNGVNNFELINPNTRKIIETINAQILKSPFLNTGQIDMSKKKIT